MCVKDLRWIWRAGSGFKIRLGVWGRPEMVIKGCGGYGEPQMSVNG